MIIFGIILGLIILVLLVVVHELGHAIVARRNGVVVEEFGIGFPPRAWGKKLKNGITFTLNWLPLGGFVKLKGEHDAATTKGSYGAATFWQKTKILYAGVLMNWIVAIILFTILAWTGLPKILPNQFVVPSDVRTSHSAVTLANIVPGSAAERAGFQTGDQIISLNGTPVEESASFIVATREKAGQSVTIGYERGDEQKETEVTLGDSSQSAVFGAGIGQREMIHATWSAPLVGIGTTIQLSWETLAGLGNVIGNFTTGLIGQLSPDETTRKDASEKIQDVADSVAGPVGIVGVIFPSAQQQGITQVILLSAIISLTLAVMNALPIPAFDGGRWWTMALFRLFRKKLTREREEAIQTIGFLVMIALVVLVTTADIGKF